MSILKTAAICIFLFLSVLKSYGQGVKPAGYVVSGTIKGIDSGTVKMFTGNRTAVADSSAIVHGKFVFKGKIGSPEQRLFIISPGGWAFQAFVEDADIGFNVDTAGAMHSAYNSAMIPQIKETGSELFNVFERFKTETNWTHYLATLSALYQQIGDKKPGTDTVSLQHQKDSIAKAFMAKQSIWINNYVAHHPSSAAGVFVFSQYYSIYNELYNSPPSDFEPTLNKFTGEATKSIFYKQLSTEAAHLSQNEINTVAPDFTLQKRDNSKFTLSATRGNYTLIDFWASWCVPCRRALPYWKKVYAKYHPKGLTMLSVADDRGKSDWTHALDKEQMPWIQVIDEFPSKHASARVGVLYGATSIPFYVLLDKEGKYLISSNDEGVITAKIKEVLGK